MNETPVNAPDIVGSLDSENFFKNFKVEDISHLAHVAFTDMILYSFENTGAVFRTEEGQEASELTGKTTTVNKELGRGNCRFKKATIKNKNLVTRIDIIPTCSHISTCPSYSGGMAAYTYGVKYWDDGSDAGYSIDVGSISVGGVRRTQFGCGKYFKVVFHINDNGTERTVEKVIDSGINNTIGTFTQSPLSAVQISLSNEIVAAALHKNAYVTQVDLMESNSASPSKWFKANICGLKFYVDTLNS